MEPSPFAFRPSLSIRWILVLVGIALAGCGKSTPAMETLLPGLLEEYPELDSKWLEETLTQSEAVGVIVLEKSGRFRTQRLGHAMTPALITNELREATREWHWEWTLDIESEESIAQLPSALILVEEGTTFEPLQLLLLLFGYLESIQEVKLVVWNQNLLVSQVTSILVSHSSDYPEYGFILFVETKQASSGDWHFRWGNPSGRYVSMHIDPDEIRYDWTEVETLKEVIHQLENRFEYDKTIHLTPAIEQDVGVILELIDGFLRAGFLYVDLEGAL